jgi:hypothetical protein
MHHEHSHQAQRFVIFCHFLWACCIRLVGFGCFAWVPLFFSPHLFTYPNMEYPRHDAMVGSGWFGAFCGIGMRNISYNVGRL